MTVIELVKKLLEEYDINAEVYFALDNEKISHIDYIERFNGEPIIHATDWRKKNESVD